nr:SpaH/EbpB family LPXTG-anchored major pilin [Zhihengliuella flava]
MLPAALAAVLVALLALFGSASSALAAPAPGQEGAPSSGSLTIHKYAGTPSGQANDGTELDPEPGRQPIAGVEFTVTAVTEISGTAVDLTTAAGWDAVAAYTTTPPETADLTLGSATTVTTNGTGVGVAADLPVGLYLVQETGNGGHNITEPAADFLVTVPFPQAEDGWNYNVHVYPKNTIEGVAEKTVDDASAQGQGDAVTWTVTSPALGSGDAGRPLTNYRMTDDLDQRLQFVPGSVVVAVNGTPVDAEYYTVTHPGGLGGDLVIAFTSTGLDYLDAQAADAVVTFAFDTEVQGIGEVPNQATLIVGDGTVEDTYETNIPNTPWGAVVISKYDAADQSRLAGAVFEVYTNAEGSGSPVSIDVEGVATTEFTTAADGTVTVPGLKAGTYWLKETQAPAGYTLPTELFEVTVVAGETAQTSTVTTEISNQQQTVPELPLTGANGQLLLTLGGIALLMVALGLVLVKRRKATSDA